MTDSILLVVLLFVMLFVYVRYLAPLVIKWRRITNNGVVPRREEGRASSFIVFAAEGQVIPSNQWRLIDTGINFYSVGILGIRFSTQNYSPGFFGQIVARAVSPFYTRGLRVHPRLSMSEAGSVKVMIYNDNQKYFHEVKPGDPIAIVEFSRVPFVVLKETKKGAKAS
jgi:hypothetical protein